MCYNTIVQKFYWDLLWIRWVPEAKIQLRMSSALGLEVRLGLGMQDSQRVGDGRET